jgi:DNA polymerase III subunit epsilon
MSSVTRQTGITDDMVAGQTIDVTGFAPSSNLPISLSPTTPASIGRSARPSRPSSLESQGVQVSEIDWAFRDFEGTKLGYRHRQMERPAWEDRCRSRRSEGQHRRAQA